MNFFNFGNTCTIQTIHFLHASNEREKPHQFAKIVKEKFMIIIIDMKSFLIYSFCVLIFYIFFMMQYFLLSRQLYFSIYTYVIFLMKSPINLDPHLNF